MKTTEDKTTTELKKTTGTIIDVEPDSNDDIGVKINMPSSKVKTLIYCLAAIVVVGVIVVVGFIQERSTSYYETSEYQRILEATKDSIIEGKEYFAEYSDTAIIIAIHELEARDSSNVERNVENNNSGAPYADYQDAWEEQQMEEAMNSLAEEAMQEEARERAMEDAMNSMDPFN